MRYWVHALRYIRAYWSKREVRDTVLNEEQERKLEEDDEDGVSHHVIMWYVHVVMRCVYIDMY